MHGDHRSRETSGTNVMIMFGQRFRKVNIEAHRLIH